jgi:hypothetical protein
MPGAFRGTDGSNPVPPEPLVTGAQSCAFTGATRTELPDRDAGFPGPLSEIVPGAVTVARGSRSHGGSPVPLMSHTEGRSCRARAIWPSPLECTVRPGDHERNRKFADSPRIGSEALRDQAGSLAAAPARPMHDSRGRLRAPASTPAQLLRPVRQAPPAATEPPSGRGL